MSGKSKMTPEEFDALRPRLGRLSLDTVALAREVLVDGRTIACLRPGDFVGEIAFLTGVSATATVKATEPLRALVLEREKLDPVHPLRIEGEMTGDLRDRHGHMHSLSSRIMKFFFEPVDRFQTKMINLGQDIYRRIRANCKYHEYGRLCLCCLIKQK